MKIHIPSGPNGFTITANNDGSMIVRLVGGYELFDEDNNSIGEIMGDRALHLKPSSSNVRKSAYKNWRPVVEGKVVDSEQYGQGVTVLSKFVNNLKVDKKRDCPDLGLVNFKMIPAIKAVRDSNVGAGLKEAKEFVELVANEAIEDLIGTGYDPSRIRTALWIVGIERNNQDRSYLEYLSALPKWKATPEITEPYFWAAKTLIQSWGAIPYRDQ